MRSTARPDVLVVLVLYRMRAVESPAYRSLATLRMADSAFAARFGLLLWDNSPAQQPLPEGFHGVWHHDDRNPGLAAAYTAALDQAHAEGIEWLMLLDQDTPLTAEYLREVLARVADAPVEVSVLLPRLRHHGTVVSPFRPRLWGPSKSWEGSAGVAATTLQAFNSGALVRVLAIKALDGFDRRFPLDYLDHATFAALQHAGGRIHVMAATLEHDLSTDTRRASTAQERARAASILAAERRFYRWYGSRAARFLHPVRLARRAASVLIRKRDVPGALQILRHLF